MRWNHSSWLPRSSFVVVREAPRAVSSSNTGQGVGALTVFETAADFVVEVDVPGYQESDLEISMHEDQLQVSGDRKLVSPESARELLNERSGSGFRRVLKLREPVQRDTITAELRNGVLVIRLQKVPATQPQKIGIRTI